MRSCELILDRVSKIYDATQVPAVNDVTLEVEQGQFVTMLGPSGCGKTTLLRMIGGFVVPSAGRVLVRGEDVTDLPPQRRPTAMVFQNYALFPHMTVTANVAFGLRVRRVPKGQIAEVVQKMLNVVGLKHLGDRFPHQLSGGQQQRVALARALAVEPPVLLMDEPLGALDAKLREEMQFELRSIQRRLEITTIYVTHDQEEAFNMSDKVAVMNQGRILQIGPPDEIYRRPVNTFVADFVGRSNALRGMVCDNGRGIRTIDGRIFSVIVPDRIKPTAEVALVIRPEDVAIGEVLGADNRVDGIVEHRRFVGSGQLYYVRISANSVVIAEDRTGTSLRVGERVQLSWRNDHAILLSDDS